MVAKRRNDGRLKKLWLPAGLVIPCFAGPDLARVKFRPSKPMENGPKYLPLTAPEGQTVDTRPYIIGSGSVWIVVESELDGFLIFQEAGDLAGIVVMGSATYRPDRETADLLRKADIVLNALDSDRAGADSFWSWWRSQFANSERLPIPEGYGKDPSEAFQKGLDIRVWILAGLKVYGRLRSEALLSPTRLEDFKERAAIIEFDGGLTRPEAERMALELIKGGWE
jgi:DNA primase